MNDADFERGRLVGELEALKEVLGKHERRMDGHAARLRLLERILWVLTGVGVFFQIWPQIQMMIKQAAGGG